MRNRTNSLIVVSTTIFLTIVLGPKITNAQPDCTQTEAVTCGEVKSGSLIAGDGHCFTFNAQTGDVVSIVMTETGGSISPKITLYSPDGESLITETGSVTAGIYGQALTTSGTYTIQASDDGKLNIGDYNITWQKINDPPCDSTAITCGEVLSDSIAASAQLNLYSFAADAGDVVSIVMTETGGSISPKITLYSPDGESLITETGSVTAGIYGQALTTSGTYTIQASDDGKLNTGDYEIFWTFEDGSYCEGLFSSPIVLSCGQDLTGNLSTLEVDHYTFDIDSSTSVNVKLVETSGNIEPLIRLYGADGAMIQSATGSNAAEILGADLPTAGTYSLLVADEGYLDTGSYSVSWIYSDDPTCGEAPTITTISPDSGGNTGTVTITVTGSRIHPDAQVKLVKEGDGEIIPERTTGVDDGTSITATFSFESMTVGLCDLVVTNPNGTETTLPDAFKIEDGGQAIPWVDIIGRNVIRREREQRFWITYGNSGNIDAEEQVIILSWPENVELVIEGARSAYDDDLFPMLSDTRKFQGVFIPNTSSTTSNEIPILITAPEEAASVDLEVVIVSADDLNSLDVEKQAENNNYNMNRNSDPPTGATVFMGPHWSNPFGHEAIAVKFGEEIFIWDLWLAQEQPGTSQPIPFDDWKIKSGGQYLGWGTPPGWQDSLGELVADNVKQIVEGGEASWVLAWGPKKENNEFTCSSLVEYVYEKSGINPIGGGVDPWLLTPGLHYRYFTGRKDFYDSADDLDNDVFVTILFKLNSWSDNINGGLIDFIRKFATLKKFIMDVVNSFDPNDKVGSQGFGEYHFLSGGEILKYIIFFENVETATAPAQLVNITDRLDFEKIDIEFLELGTITFGDHIVTPPSGLKEYTSDVDLRPNNDLIVRLEVTLNDTEKTLTWRFTSLDPDTMEPTEDPLAGFLPPNVMPPEGEGSVMFNVMPKESLVTGTEVSNEASIVFDVNEPIETPTWINTIDKEKPMSQVGELAAEQSATFEVFWTGDDGAGSGIKEYTVYVSDEAGTYEEWLSTSDSSAEFTGEVGHTYRFYSIAKDNVGHLEDPPDAPDVVTTIVETDTDTDTDSDTGTDGDTDTDTDSDSDTGELDGGIDADDDGSGGCSCRTTGRSSRGLFGSLLVLILSIFGI